MVTLRCGGALIKVPITIKGLIPDVPSVRSLKQVLFALRLCPKCGGSGYTVEWSSPPEQLICTDCISSVDRFWVDGPEYYMDTTTVEDDEINLQRVQRGQPVLYGFALKILVFDET